MGFSKVRQHLPWSSRHSRADLARPEENCFHMELSSPARTRREDRASKVDVTARVSTAQSQGSAIQAHHSPKKLQPSPSSQPVNSLPSPVFSNPYMYANCQQLPSPPVFELALIPVRVPPRQYPASQQHPPRILPR